MISVRCRESRKALRLRQSKPLSGIHVQSIYRLPYWSKTTSQPKEKRKAAQSSNIRWELSGGRALTQPALKHGDRLWRLTAQGTIMKSSTFRMTSDGTSRMTEVMSATVTVER
jgi:hypothetical protein